MNPESISKYQKRKEVLINKKIQDELVWKTVAQNVAKNEKRKRMVKTRNHARQNPQNPIGKKRINPQGIGVIHNLLITTFSPIFADHILIYSNYVNYSKNQG